MRLINKTHNGQVFKCHKCNLIHIEFNNLNFNFSVKQFNHFANYIQNLNCEYWEEKNIDSNFIRKIFIPIGHKNFNIVLNSSEFQELKELLFNLSDKTRNLKQKRVINFDFSLNLN